MRSQWLSAPVAAASVSGSFRRSWRVGYIAAGHRVSSQRGRLRRESPRNLIVASSHQLDPVLTSVADHVPMEGHGVPGEDVLRAASVVLICLRLSAWFVAVGVAAMVEWIFNMLGVMAELVLRRETAYPATEPGWRVRGL